MLTKRSCLPRATNEELKHGREKIKILKANPDTRNIDLLKRVGHDKPVQAIIIIQTRYDLCFGKKEAMMAHTSYTLLLQELYMLPQGLIPGRCVRHGIINLCSEINIQLSKLAGTLIIFFVKQIHFHTSS